MPSSPPTYDQQTSLYEWYKCACTLLLCILASYMWIHHKILYQGLQRKVEALAAHQENLEEHQDTYEKDESLKYGMLRSLLMSLQQDLAFYQTQVDTLQKQHDHDQTATETRVDTLHTKQEQYQEDQKETLQHILDVYQSVKKWMDNEKQRQKVWYDKDTDTYVLSTEVEHNVFVHEAFTFRHGELGYSFGGYLGRFASTKKYVNERNPRAPIFAMPMDIRLRGNPTLSPFLTDWMNQEE